MEFNQAVLYVERLPDTNQMDHIDWGFRYSMLYGLDYRFTISRGWFSDQLLKHNSYSGFDMPMVYLDLYIPYVFQGMNVRIGRIISEPDIEAQLAPNNLMASHSILYGFDPYCQEGIFTTTKINNQWTIQLGISDGTDVAIWQSDPGRQPTGTVMVQWISPNQMDSIYAGDNVINNGEFGYNNMQQFVGTWTHKFNDTIYTATEAWYMYMKDAIDHPTSEVPFQSGSFPVRNGYAPEWRWSTTRCSALLRAPFSPFETNILMTRLGAGLASRRSILSIPLELPGGPTSSSPYVQSFVTIILTMKGRTTTERGITSSPLSPT